jgi:dolichol-phosphate mannosyltransferase
MSALATLPSDEERVHGRNGRGLPRAPRRSWLRSLLERIPAEREVVRRFVRFALVGASGIVVNEAAIAVFVSGFGIQYVIGSVLATQCSTLWNFGLLEIWAFKSSSHRNQRWQRWAMLMLLNNAANVATIPLLVFCTSVLGINYLISNFFTLVVVIVGRFVLADRIWAPGREVEVGADLAH